MSLAWLHLTDWHLGQRGQEERYPELEAKLYADLKQLFEEIGKLDLVFFTGDLVNHGTTSDFEILEKRLQKLWHFFDDLGCCPKLVTVPGNHDLERPTEFSMASQALRNWNLDPALRTIFWESEGSELRKGVSDFFKPYQKWKETTQIPGIEEVPGTLPGDFMARFDCNGISLGILGLNTTFLQYGGSFGEGSLWVSPKQLPRTQESDYREYLNGVDLKVVMTHHPEAWLEKRAQQQFRSSIAPSGLFDLHLCGHLHVPLQQNLSEGGGAMRMMRQGASFFGLEKYGDGNEDESRIHGYSIGVWSKKQGLVREKYFPRLVVRKQDGGWGLASDHTSYLDDDGKSISRVIREINNCESDDDDKNCDPIKKVAVPTKVFADEIDRGTSDFPKIEKKFSPGYAAVWVEERIKFQALLKTTSILSVAADWGFGRLEFISSSVFGLERSKASERLLEFDDVLILKCDSMQKPEDIEGLFRQQFGKTIHEFCQIIAHGKPMILVLDGLQPDLFQGKSSEKLRSIFSLLVDFSEHLRVIVTSRIEVGGGVPSVVLRPLDAPETRAFIEADSRCREDLLNIEAVERIHFGSGGLPTQIDRLLDQLEVASLDSVLEHDNHGEIQIEPSDALRRCVGMVLGSDEQHSEMKSSELLKALSVLPYGSTLDLIKRFNPKSLIYPPQATELLRLNLLDAMPLHTDASAVSKLPTVDSTSALSPKILRVPKQVRDCVLSQLSAEDRSSLLYLASEFIFGKKWRLGGSIKLKKVPFYYQEYISSGLGNEYAVIRSLLSGIIESGDDKTAKKILKLAIHYCGVLRKTHRNNDIKVVSSSILHLIEPGDFCVEERQLHNICGRASRLCGDYADGAKHFETVVDLWDGETASDSYIRTLVELSMCYSGLNRLDDEMKCIQEAKSLVTKGTDLESQIIAREVYREEVPVQKAKITMLEKQARSKSWVSHANDLAITLAATESGLEAKLKSYDRVISSSEEGRNKFRAVVAKGGLLMREKKLEKMTQMDHVYLLKAYQYFHAQRSDSFTKCHKILWEVMENKSSLASLYSLFWHSSFIWRIEGNTEIEKEYLSRLVALEESIEFDTSKGFKLEISYFKKRAKILVVRLLSVGSS